MRRRQIVHLHKDDQSAQEQSGQAFPTFKIERPKTDHELARLLMRLVREYGIYDQAIFVSERGIRTFPRAFCPRCGKHIGKGIGLHLLKCTETVWAYNKKQGIRDNLKRQAS